MERYTCPISGKLSHAMKVSWAFLRLLKSKRNETHGFLRETTRNFKTSLGFAFCKDAHCLNNMFFFQSYGAVTEEDTSTDRCVDKLGQLGPPGFGPTG